MPIPINAPDNAVNNWNHPMVVRNIVGNILMLTRMYATLNRKMDFVKGAIIQNFLIE